MQPSKPSHFKEYRMVIFQYTDTENIIGIYAHKQRLLQKLAVNFGLVTTRRLPGSQFTDCEFLEFTFRDNLIYTRCSIEWPPRSPDL